MLFAGGEMIRTRSKDADDEWMNSRYDGLEKETKLVV